MTMIPRLFLAAALAVVATSASSAPSVRGCPSQPINFVKQDFSGNDAYVRVNGNRLHYVDWGGTGETLLLIPGLGSSARVFEDIAPLLRRNFRVLALTRRGQGWSDRPDCCYDAKTLGDDVVAFMDLMGLKRVTLAGHSLGGIEVTEVATRHPERIARAIYLDAAQDFGTPIDIALPSPQPGEANTRSRKSFTNWYARQLGFWSKGLDADFQHSVYTDDQGRFIGGGVDENVGKHLQATLAAYKPDYRPLRMPVLMIYTYPLKPENLYLVDCSANGVALARTYIGLRQKREIPFFRHLSESVPNIRLIAMPGTDHMLFSQKPREVTAYIREFIATTR
jgi:pimeloyl-ACP methyl ester carboxylesterase